MFWYIIILTLALLSLANENKGLKREIHALHNRVRRLEPKTEYNKCDYDTIGYSMLVKKETKNG